MDQMRRQDFFGKWYFVSYDVCASYDGPIKSSHFFSSAFLFLIRCVRCSRFCVTVVNLCRWDLIFRRNIEQWMFETDLVKDNIRRNDSANYRSFEGLRKIGGSVRCRDISSCTYVIATVCILYYTCIVFENLLLLKIVRQYNLWHWFWESGRFYQLASIHRTANGQSILFWTTILRRVVRSHTCTQIF